MTTTPKETFEVEVDTRQRISLAKVRQQRHSRYRVTENEYGEITLTPLVSIPAREMILLDNPMVRASLTEAVKQAEVGDLHDLGSFAQYLDGADEG